MDGFMLLIGEENLISWLAEVYITLVGLTTPFNGWGLHL
jgi:hypothetical protein